MKRAYGDPSAYIPSDKKAKRRQPAQSQTGGRKSKFQRNQSQSRSTSQRRMGGDYIDFYQRVKEVASDRNWSEKQVNDMLKDPKKFEKEYISVSIRMACALRYNYIS